MRPSAFALRFQFLYNILMVAPPPRKSGFDSRALYAACGSASAEEQATAYRELWRYLYQVAAYMTHNQPDGDALAQDCAQRALLRVHQMYAQCHEPPAFRSWARRIVSNLVIDELRRQKRWQPLTESEQETLPADADRYNPETAALITLTAVSLRDLLQQAPISERSRRLVIGRYLDNLTDETLAQTESQLSDNLLLPSHVQVTRAKNIAKLRQWPLLARFLQESSP